MGTPIAMWQPMHPGHPGVVATKVRYFGAKSTKVPRGQMGT